MLTASEISAHCRSGPTVIVAAETQEAQSKHRNGIRQNRFGFGMNDQLIRSNSLDNIQIVQPVGGSV